MKTIDTQAGDDSEGKMWGLEGSSLFIVIGGVVIGVIATVAAFSYWSCPPMIALGYGAVPAILGIIYVFTLRERRPKSFDKDLLETLICGRSWKCQAVQKQHLLYLAFLCLLLPGYLHAQFMPSQYTDVEGGKNYEFTLARDEAFGIYIGAIVLWTSNSTLHTARIFLNDREVYFHKSSNGDTGSGQESGFISRLVQGPLKAGTKIYLKGIVEAPRDPTARLFSLSANAVGYDAAVNLVNLEQKINHLETTLQNQVNQNTNRISENVNQLLNLKSELNNFRQRFDALNLDYSQFKTDVVTRIDTIDKKITSVENYLNAKIAALTQRFDNFDRNYSRFKTDTETRLEKADKGIFSLSEGLNQFKTETNSRLSAVNEKNAHLEKRFATFQADHSGFKANVDSRFETINKRHSSLEKKFGTELNGFSQRLDKFQGEQEQQNSGINARFSALERRSLRRDRLNNTLGIIGTSVGGTALLLGAGTIVSQAVDEHKSLHEAYEQEQSTEGSSL